MKNIFLLPTDKPSRLYEWGRKELKFTDHPITNKRIWCQNIYITNDEEIKEGDWYFDGTDLIHKKTKYNDSLVDGNKQAKKIILTTDQDLIKAGVQAIGDGFLEWFVKNPTCEFVKVEGHIYKGQDETEYKIIIPSAEPKTAWVGVLHDKLNEYHPAEYGLKDIYQGEGCLPNFPNKELCQIWCDSEYANDRKTQESTEEAAEKYTKSKAIPLQEIYTKAFIEGAKWKQEQDKKSYSEEEVIDILVEFSAEMKNISNITKWFEKY